MKKIYLSILAASTLFACKQNDDDTGYVATPPSSEAGLVISSDDVQSNTVDLKVTPSVKGTISYVILPKDSPAPTAHQVRLGQGVNLIAKGNTEEGVANTETLFDDVTGLYGGIDYTAYAIVMNGDNIITSNPVSTSFKYEDSERPTLLTRTPEHTSTNNDIFGTQMVLTFDEPVTLAGEVLLTVYNLDGTDSYETTVSSADVAYEGFYQANYGTALTISLPDFKAGENIVVTYPDTAFQDVSTNGALAIEGYNYYYSLRTTYTTEEAALVLSKQCWNFEMSGLIQDATPTMTSFLGAFPTSGEYNVQVNASDATSVNLHDAYDTAFQLNFNGTVADEFFQVALTEPDTDHVGLFILPADSQSDLIFFTGGIPFKYFGWWDYLMEGLAGLYDLSTNEFFFALDVGDAYGGSYWLGDVNYDYTPCATDAKTSNGKRFKSKFINDFLEKNKKPLTNASVNKNITFQK